MSQKINYVKNKGALTQPYATPVSNPIMPLLFFLQTRKPRAFRGFCGVLVFPFHQVHAH